MLKTELINCDVSSAQFACNSVFLQFTNSSVQTEKYWYYKNCDYIMNFVKVKLWMHFGNGLIVVTQTW